MSVSVVIPVGPLEAHRKYLAEAIRSVREQTLPSVELVIVDDMAGIDLRDIEGWAKNTMLEKNLWRLGVPASFNVGVSLAKNDCVFMMGADDTLEPDCLEKCYDAFCYERVDRRHYMCYWIDIKYMRSGETQGLACNAMMVTKTLWKHTGGFPPESAVGACDTMWHSMRLANPDFAGDVHVCPGTPLYNYRERENSDTAQHGDPRFQTAIFAVRDVLTETWSPPLWGRFA